MKKILFSLFLSYAGCLFAQHYNPENFDQQHNIQTGDGGMLSLVAEKYLVELGENDMLTVRINWVNPGDEDNVIPQQYDYRFTDPTRAPWKITKWEIIEGGGELAVGPDNYYAVYKSPSVMPVNKSATISVTLIAQDPTKPKVILLKTVYFADNSNVFYYNCPAYGVLEEKYIINQNNGIMQTPNNTSEAMKYATPQQKAQIEALQRRQQGTQLNASVATAEQGFDAGALTSNAKAIYAKDKNVTTIIIQGKNVSMVKGQPSDTKRDYNIVLSFPGQSTGTFKIKTIPEISATVVLFKSGQSCTCDFDPKSGDTPPPCMGGTIYITKYENKSGGYVEGTVYANIQGAVGQQTIFGDINGKFKVKLANLQ
jgi:hypothetical protein